jgi:hypothetical protein
LLKSEFIMTPAGWRVTLRPDDPGPKGHLFYVPAG